ncbi:MAG: hypothetical protein WCV62_02990 [Candidatus Peribacteraceae bacterium]|jgi:hypothetical protein
MTPRRSNHTAEGYEDLFHGLLNVPNPSVEWQETKGRRSVQYLQQFRENVGAEPHSPEFSREKILAALHAAETVANSLTASAASVQQVREECAALIHTIMNELPPLPALSESSSQTSSHTPASWETA